MKVYEVKAVKVTYDWGRFDGYRHIDYTLNKARAEEIANAEKARIEAIEYWWLTTGKDKDGRPDVRAVELGEVDEYHITWKENAHENL